MSAPGKRSLCLCIAGLALAFFPAPLLCALPGSAFRRNQPSCLFPLPVPPSSAFLLAQAGLPPSPLAWPGGAWPWAAELPGATVKDWNVGRVGGLGEWGAVGGGRGASLGLGQSSATRWSSSHQAMPS